MSDYRFCLWKKNPDEKTEFFFCSPECQPVEQIDKLCSKKKDELLKKNSKDFVYSTLYPCSPYLPQFLDIMRAGYNTKKLFKRCEKNGFFT